MKEKNTLEMLIKIFHTVILANHSFISMLIFYVMYLLTIL